MKNILTFMMIFGFSLCYSQPVDYRDFKDDYLNFRKFKKYRDSINLLNKTNYDREYLEDFKIHIKKKDSIKKINELKFNNTLKSEYIEGTKLNDYFGTYILTEIKNSKNISYSGKMYITEDGISIIPEDNLYNIIRTNYDFGVKKIMKDYEYKTGEFYIYQNSSYGVILINLQNNIVTVNVNKTIYSFLISKKSK